MADPDLNFLQKALEGAEEMLSELRLLAQRDGDPDLAQRAQSALDDVFTAIVDVDHLRAAPRARTALRPDPAPALRPLLA